ncbi:hypothetical protein CC79DRAFT_982693 [Sarocladium strictum]
MTHTKSRLGCKECKARRVKCDEAKPSCARCANSKRQCSFLAEIPDLPASLSATSRSSNASSEQPVPRAAAPLTSSCPVSSSFPIFPVSCNHDEPDHTGASRIPSLEERYGLLHLSLLHHFEHELANSMRSVHPGLEVTVPMIAAEAFDASYLMDELLALSAAHKSTQAPETRSLYALEATRLQGRALETLNRLRPQVTPDNCMPMFVFSSLVGQHALFNMSNAMSDDLGALLDGLVDCIGLHRGISTIALSAWPLLKARLWGEAGETCLEAGSQSANGKQDLHGDGCEQLLRRIDDSGISASMVNANRETVMLLHHYFLTLSPNASNSHWLAAVQEWLAAVPADYVECLRQRRPETLVVLAHFAVMLHYTSKYWFIGDLGARLVQLITRHLGSYWGDWLAWPNLMICEDRGHSTIP